MRETKQPTVMTEKPTVRADERSLDRSKRLLEHGRRLIPGCTQTGSKGPNQWVGGVVPTHLERGEGCHVWDVDENEYVDYTMSLGPIILGHDYPAVTEAVESQLEDGTMFTMPHPLQVEVADLLRAVVPCAEMVRFGKNGNDVTTLAAKLARAYTSRDIIASQGYHGWPDVWMGHTGMNRGIPDTVGEYTESFDYNDVESLERILEEHPDDVAAVVTTPVNIEEPEDNFLERVRELTHEHDALLVFDEILSGFRFALGGAQERFGVTPDLACFAKGMANGYPISALVGREDVMGVIVDDDFYYSMTYAGEALSLAATKASVETIRDEPVVDHLYEQGREVLEGYNDLAADHGLADRTQAKGFAPRFVVQFLDEEGESDHLAKSLFMQECVERGVLFSGTHLPSYSHTAEDVSFTLDVYDEALAALADAIKADAIADRLKGDPVGATLRQRTGEHD
jgi:glutamate-1-semialdehyde aminotransferase